MAFPRYGPFTLSLAYNCDIWALVRIADNEHGNDCLIDWSRSRYLLLRLLGVVYESALPLSPKPKADRVTRGRYLLSLETLLVCGNNDAPLLSVVIPTRNRQEYAISCVESILRIQDPGLEVVVQDNSDTRELEELLGRNVRDSRLRYSYTSAPLSIIHNFEAAVHLATGDYLCFIGDDDGVNPEIMEATRWAKANAIDTLKPAYCVNYLWPGSGIPSTLFSDVPQETGFLTIEPFSEKIVYPDKERELRKLVRKGGQECLDTELPKLYHGIVSRECLDRVREKAGTYFGGLSPDIYASVSIANTAKTSVSIDYPLTLPGACRKSGSVESQVGKHIGDLEDAPHLNNRGAYEWAEQVPRYYSVATIWADSTIVALRDLGREDLLNDFNVAYLAAYCLWSHPQYGKVILQNLYRALRLSGNNMFVGTIQLGFSFIIGPWRLLFKRIANRLRIILRGETLTLIDSVRVNDMIEATDALTRYLKANGHSFRSALIAANETGYGPRSESALSSSGQ